MAHQTSAEIIAKLEDFLKIRISKISTSRARNVIGGEVNRLRILRYKICNRGPF